METAIDDLFLEQYSTPPNYQVFFTYIPGFSFEHILTHTP